MKRWEKCANNSCIKNPCDAILQLFANYQEPPATGPDSHEI